MTWPTWIDELKERYLAGEGSVFLLYGNVAGDRWNVEGRSLDCAEVLVAFLQRTRQVVGVLRPDAGLTFSAVTDRAQFDRLVKAEELMLGDATRLSDEVPEQALGRIWRALGNLGVDQGYIVTEVERMLPGHRKRVEDLAGGAPGLFEWPTHPRLTQSNNIVLFLAADRSKVRPELVDAAVNVHVDVEPAVPIEQLVAEAHLTDDVVAVPEPAPRPAPAPVPAPSPASAAPPTPAQPAPGPVSGTEADPVAALRPEVEAAVVRALLAHPEEHRPARIPVMAAAAEVLASRLPHLGALTFTLDDEGAVVVDGPGEEWFHAAWRGDIALDAAAGMLIKSLKGGFSEEAPPALDDTAINALTKRLLRILDRG